MDEFFDGEGIAIFVIVGVLVVAAFIGASL